MRGFGLWAGLLGVLGVLLIAAAPVTHVVLRPAPQNGVQDRPFFDYRLAPGSRVEDAVLVSNPGTEPVVLSLFPSDARTAPNGGLIFPGQPDETPQGAGSWLRLAERTLRLSVGETRRVAFDLRVPLDAAGEYVAGIVARAESASAGEGALPVAVVTQAAVAVRVWVTAAGVEPLPALRLDAAQVDTAGEDQTLVLRLVNEGTQGVKGEGHVMLWPPAGEWTRQMPLQMGYVLAGEAVTLRLPLTPPLVPGAYRLRMVLQGPALPPWTAEGEVRVAGGVESGGAGFRVATNREQAGTVPSLMTAVLVLLLVVVVLQGWWIYRHRR